MQMTKEKSGTEIMKETTEMTAIEHILHTETATQMKETGHIHHSGEMTEKIDIMIEIEHTRHTEEMTGSKNAMADAQLPVGNVEMLE